MADRGDSADGAWGLRFPQLLEAKRVLMPVPEGRTVSVAIQTNVIGELPADDDWDNRGMRVPLPTGGYLEVTWPAHIDLRLRDDPPAECLVAPHLSTAAGAIAMKLGHQPFHAGAFMVDGGLWGVLGARTAGKSSTLAMLHRRGLSVLTDDLLVVDHGVAFAGPRCIDLRVGAARVLGIGTDLGVVGRRERWRVYLDECPRQAAMRGWIVPEWGPEGLTSVAAKDRLPSLMKHSFFQGITMNDPFRYLELASLPTIVWTRPKDWTKAEMALDRLLDQIVALSEGKQ